MDLEIILKRSRIHNITLTILKNKIRSEMEDLERGGSIASWRGIDMIGERADPKSIENLAIRQLKTTAHRLMAAV